VPAIIATPGAQDANSYASVAEYIAYAADRMDVPEGTTVSGASITDDEAKALIEAARDLDTLPWDGWLVAGSWSVVPQRLAFPRYSGSGWPGVENPFLWAGITPAIPYVGGEAIPRRLKEAQVELAFAYRSGGTRPDQVDTSAGIVRKKVDVLETEWEAGARPMGLARYPRVLALVAPLLATSGDVVRA
jgi:hypothetical protein